MNETTNDMNPKGSLCVEILQNENKIDIERTTLGILTKSFQKRIVEAITKAIEPYGTNYMKFSRICDHSSIVIPGDILYRSIVLNGWNADKIDTIKTFSNSLKSYCKDVLIAESLNEIELSLKDNAVDSYDQYPSCVEEEEQGYVTVHVALIPNSTLYRPTHLFRNNNNQKMGRKRKRQHNNIESQGGNPRSTLEQKLNQQSKFVWTLNQAMDEMLSIINDKSDSWREGIETMVDETCPDSFLDIHVAVWRRPIYIRGMYTKSRRDISQTPFYVVDKGQRRKLGNTSVEEEISKVLVKHLGGLSTLNNSDDPSSKVVYGMAKFHASGREDMDVRMLLPSIQVHNRQITGRPFVYEIIDALQMLTPTMLDKIVQQINHTLDTFDASNNHEVKVVETIEPMSSKLNVYGNNPAGVDISTDLKFVASTAFKRLQAETEDKVKFYGCLCWSQNILPNTVETIQDALGNCPIEIQQWTPIRVLHRRTRLQRIRHVLSLVVTERIDDHYFRLSLSTDASTYVKEFVHSDLGRTQPSISSLLGCQTDILELDCEGIQL